MWRRAELALVVLFTASPAAASELTLDEVVASVVKHYPSLEAVRAQQRKAAAELLAARGGFDPRLTGTGKYRDGYYEYGLGEVLLVQPTPLWGLDLIGGWRLGRGLEEGVSLYGGIPDYYGGDATYDAGEVRAGIQVPLWRDGPIDRTRAAISRAELEQPVAAMATAEAQLEAVYLGSQKYWDWVAAGQKLAVARALLEIASTRDSQVRERVERGDIPGIDAVDNRRLVLQREGLVVSARRALEAKAIELSIYLRDENGDPVLPDPARLPAGFPQVEALGEEVVAAGLERAVRVRPEVRILAGQVEQAVVELRLSENQLAPAIDVNAFASKDLGEPTAGLSPKQGDLELEVGLKLDIPILNRVARGKVRGVEAELAKLRAKLQLARDGVVASVRDAVSAIAAARSRVELLREEVEATRQIEAGERTRFELGDSSLLVVNLREQSTAEAEIKLIDAQNDYFRALAAWRAATAAGVAE